LLSLPDKSENQYNCILQNRHVCFFYKDYIINGRRLQLVCPKSGARWVILGF
jgi:hypothetical protein